jgi:hypothetical protein
MPSPQVEQSAIRLTDLRGAISPASGKHMAKITDPSEIAGFYVPLMIIGAALLPDVPCNWHHWYLSGPENSVMPNG